MLTYSSLINSVYFIDPLEQFAIVPLFLTHILCPSQITNLTVILGLNLFLIHFALAAIFDKGEYNI